MIPNLIRLIAARFIISNAVPGYWRIVIVGICIIALAMGTTPEALNNLPSVFRFIGPKEEKLSMSTRGSQELSADNVVSIGARKIALTYSPRKLPSVNLPTGVVKHTFQEKINIGNGNLSIPSQFSRQGSSTEEEDLRGSVLSTGWTVASSGTSSVPPPSGKSELRRYYSRNNAPHLKRYVNRIDKWKEVSPPRTVRRMIQPKDSTLFLIPLPARATIKNE